MAKSTQFKENNSPRFRSRTKKNHNFDPIDIKITKELLENPDTSSIKIAKKLGIPLSTIQRRLAKLEESKLIKSYSLNAHNLGWRNAEILMLVEEGKVDLTSEEIIKKFENVIGTSTRINTSHNIALTVGFRNSEELHQLMEKLRAIPRVSNLEWSEIVKKHGNENSRMASLIFNSTTIEKN